MSIQKKIFHFIFLLLFAFLLLPAFLATGSGKNVIELSIDGPIGPATSDYIKRAIEGAVEQQAEVIVIRMDTPGGLDASMRVIIKAITTSPVPVVTYVSPSGARAASAGTYILYASHIAAMAPGTNLGAATPVQLIGSSPEDQGKPGTKEGDAKKPGVVEKDAKKSKIINDASAYIRGLADLRGRNRDWAEKAVREAASLSAEEALKLNVITIVATDMADLLRQINGMEMSVQGVKRKIQTAGLPVVKVSPDWRSRFLNVISDPNVAYILMLIGIYGLILEFSNPGAIVPGTAGAICLLLALYAFQLLPINYAGVALILLGVALMVGEAFQPSFGMLGIGGAVAFVVGSIILIDTDAPGFGIDISVIITFTLSSALIFILVVGMAVRARRRPVVTGMEELIGGEAVVQNDFDGEGTVKIHSELWRAICSRPLHKGEHVRVTGVKGLSLQVEPMNNPLKEEK